MSTLAVDKLYHIMDYSSNYYKVDAKDQLVVAGDESEATVFSFVEANKRIGAGRKSSFYFMTPVDDTPLSAVRELTEGELTEKVERSIAEDDLSKIDWIGFLNHFSFVASKLNEYRENLLKKESDVDKKICDILHYIELRCIDDKEAAELVELLRVCRENRRDIKDEIYKVDAFQKNLGTGDNVAKANLAVKAIKGLDTRKYTPRKFTELFEGSQIKIKSNRVRRERQLICKTRINMEKRAQEGKKMDYERRETVFDGKNNDWMSFAIQQAEFYKNAGQYIMNIRIDIDDIDKAIADLMDVIETANCNVAQGYKMFKRLKELRLERKEKEKELECLYILTENFDIGAMADKCKNNVDDLEQFLYGEEKEMEEDASAMKDTESIAGIAV